MKDKNVPFIKVENILLNIKQEIDKRKDKDEIIYEVNEDFVEFSNQKKNEVYDFAKKIGKFLQRKGFYKLVSFVQINFTVHKKNYVYEISDFTKYQDEEFIDNIYKLILHREADVEGKKHYLSLLRSGDLSKTQIITLVHYSKEGRKQNIIILGSKKRYLMTLLYRMPIIGYFFKLLFILVLFSSYSSFFI